MEVDPYLLLTIQSSFILGLIHGVNPCGHSWLVIAPFVSGTGKGARVALLTASFLAGTVLACLVIGATLGAISTAIPASLAERVETVTSLVLVLLGLVMLVRPGLLHHHDHDGESCACDGHGHGGALKHHKTTATGLFGIGFINMIIPCPTVAIMYGFAIESGSYVQSTIVFGVYAFSTCLAVAGMIYGIFRITTLLRTMEQRWIESAIMRTIGALTMFFGLYGLFTA